MNSSLSTGLRWASASVRLRRPKSDFLSLIPILFACVAGTVQLSRAANPLPSGVVGYWPGDGDALDHAGTNHATLDNGAFFAAGQMGQGFAFTNFQSVRIPYTTNLLPQVYSMQAWVKPTGINTNPPSGVWENIFGQRGGPGLASEPGLQGGLNVSLHAYVYSWYELRMAGEIPMNQFTHILATYDGTTAKIYTNGVLNTQGSFPSPNSRRYDTDPFFIGGVNAPVGDGYFQGVIDEVAVWNRVLTQEEITFLASWKMPQIGLVKAVRPSFSNLITGLNYQLQVSGDLNTWTNQGSAFAATNSTMVYPQYWDVDNWNRLFFRLQMSP